MRSCCLLLLLLLSPAPTLAGDLLMVKAPHFEATVRRGVLDSLKADGHVLVQPGDPVNMTGILRVDKDHWACDGTGESELVTATKTGSRVYTGLSDLPGGRLVNDYRVIDGDLVITQNAASPLPGVQGVQWGLGAVPLSYNVIVPGNGGIRITRQSPESRFQFDYPLTWDAQLVIVEGPGYGFCAWAEDAAGRFKRLVVHRDRDGWRLFFVTHNNAPFAPQTHCESVRWHVSPYRGDWRVPAKRYREWAARQWKTTPRAQQTPKWVQDIRFVSLVGMDAPVIEALAKRVDPKQTLLYVPNWRKAGYDRMYPDYTAAEGFGAFVRRAHELGFRVMAHVNYFGCDPKSPNYATYEKYQVRDPWNHEREWWLWERAEPIIKFAYISPACKAWRELQVARWKEIVAKYGVDALHLDQTLCIYNDDNGPIEGMTMLQGNVALQKELHDALPEVAISGEGLNEVTMRYEAFAQRHSYGLDFVEGTWDRDHLRMAHPISAYLLNPSTQPYGYLGMVSPENGQLYAAWRTNYKRWGVLPTLAWPTVEEITRPEGFVAQCLEEAKAFTENRLNPDPDGTWPGGTSFPYRGTGGIRAAYVDDGDGTWFRVGKRVVSRTVSGVKEVKGTGSIPGWNCYDEHRIFGLDPESWYAFSPDPRDLRAFHVSALPDGFIAQRVTATDQVAEVEVRSAGSAIWLSSLFDDAKCGVEPFEGSREEVGGPLTHSDSGAEFLPQGHDIFAHPPWRALRKNPRTGVVEASGTGVTFGEFLVRLPDGPGSIHFRTGVAMDPGAVGAGKTDGVLYGASVTGPDGSRAQAEVLNATATDQPLELDLSAYRGQQVKLRLQVHPGPKKDASFDWARWHGPRVDMDYQQVGTIRLAGGLPYELVLSSEGVVDAVTADGVRVLRGKLPGTFILLRSRPDTVSLPLDLAKRPFLTTFISAGGMLLKTPLYAGASPGDLIVGGSKKFGLNTHPPDHGVTVVDYPMVLPVAPARLTCLVGLRDGSKSDGCGFILRVNGKQVAYEHKLPGSWTEMSADLTPWAGKPVVISLVTDSEGSFAFDWGAWGEPKVVEADRG